MVTLQDKIAVVFAASGAIADAVAKSFAQYGAKVYVSGRDLQAVSKLAAEIRENGGWAEAAQVDAMQEADIENHFRKIVQAQGKVDIIFNGIGIRVSEGGYGTPTVQLPFEQFMKPLQTHVGSQFLTARIGAKYMLETQSSGTILMLTASLSRLKTPLMAGITAACSAIEGLTRVMAAEFGRAGIKVICMNPTALTETRTIQETNIANAKTMGIKAEALAQMIAQGNLLGKSPTLQDVGQTAAWLVSDAGAVFNSHVLDVDFGTSSVI